MSGTFVRSCSWAKVVVFRLLHGTGHDLGQIDAFFLHAPAISPAPALLKLNDTAMAG